MHSPQFMPGANTDSHFNALCFREINYTDHYSMPLHAHADAHLALNLKGTIKGVWRSQTVITNPSTLTFIPAEEPHANHFGVGVKMFLITLKSPWIERIRQYSALVDRPMTYQNNITTGLAVSLYREFQNQDNLTPLILEGLTLHLLAQMGRDAGNAEEGRVPRWLKQACDFLHAHFTENLSLDTIAAAVGVHPSHLIRTFRQQYHCTPGAYVRRLRVGYACHLLSASDRPLIQIALDAGFADQSHFCRTFKRLTGMTPAQFQKAPGRADMRQKLLS
jgi:AraC family transcriptional regulator